MKIAFCLWCIQTPLRIVRLPAPVQYLLALTMGGAVLIRWLNLEFLRSVLKYFFGLVLSIFLRWFLVSLDALRRTKSTSAVLLVTPTTTILKMSPVYMKMKSWMAMGLKKWKLILPTGGFAATQSIHLVEAKLSERSQIEESANTLVLTSASHVMESALQDTKSTDWNKFVQKSPSVNWRACSAHKDCPCNDKEQPCRFNGYPGQTYQGCIKKGDEKHCCPKGWKYNPNSLDVTCIGKNEE